MDFKLMLMLSALGMTCAASIQDPYIHDSVEDQIAMESGPTHTVVVAPPNFQAEAAAAAAASAPKPTEVEADGEPAEADADNEVAKPEPETIKSAVPFTVLVNDEPIEQTPAVTVARPKPSRVRPAFGAFAVRRPALSPLMQMSLLSRLQPQLQYGSPLAGYGSSPVILLQPIIVPVPMSARDAEQQPNALNEQVMSSLMFRQPVKPRPLSLMDLLQRGYYGF